MRKQEKMVMRTVLPSLCKAYGNYFQNAADTNEPCFLALECWRQLQGSNTCRISRYTELMTDNEPEMKYLCYIMPNVLIFPIQRKSDRDDGLSFN